MTVKAFLSVLTAGLLISGCQTIAPDLDILIRNGRVVDGTGREGFLADVGILGDRIVLVGNAGARKARRTIDASGLTVAPGFIDVHSHADRQAASLANRINIAGIAQGVTTAVFGPDGYYAPSKIASLTRTFQTQGLGTNYAFYVGHNGVRSEVMGQDARRVATPGEVARMATLVQQGMEAGAVGLSTGLMFDPGMYADTAEIISLTKEAGKFGGIYDTHVRDPAFNLIASDREAIAIGAEAGVPVKIAHEKAPGLLNKGKAPEIVRLIEEARVSGRDIVADQYPYDGAEIVDLATVFMMPSESVQTSVEDLRLALAEPGRTAAIKRATEKGREGGFSWVKAVGYGGWRIVDSPDHPALIDKNIQLLAEERGIGGFELIRELLLTSPRGVRMTMGTIDEADVRTILLQPWTMIATDGNGSDLAGDPKQCKHPRATGTFPRVLARYVREQRLLALPEAIRKMTSFPARFLGFSDRGVIAPDKAADVVIFSADEVADRSTYIEPCLRPTGIAYVLVNGEVVIDRGEPTGSVPGRLLRPLRGER